MSKLTTAEIKTFITQPERLQWYFAMFSAEEQPVVREETMDVRNWKRGYKVRLGRLGPQVGLELDAGINDTLEAITDEDPVILDPMILTSDCVVRYMVEPDYTLDCHVISDPTDTRILCLYWHQD